MRQHAHQAPAAIRRTYTRSRGTQCLIAVALVAAVVAASAFRHQDPGENAPAARGGSAGGPQASSGAAQQEGAEEPPAAFKRVCVRCHVSDRVVEGRRFPSQWEQVLDQMVSRGATGSDEDFDIIYDYLVTRFGRVAINTAPADEIAYVLQLETAMAEAIVKHRAKHGRFSDFDALAAVPGVDVAALRKRRDAIVF